MVDIGIVEWKKGLAEGLFSLIRLLPFIVWILRMFIEKLEIENFQRHKSLKVDFCPGLNAIIGESDHGKSSLIRAIRWVLTNKPRGAQFQRNPKGAKGNLSKASVKIFLSNGFKITRERSSNINRYILEYPNGHTEQFDNFTKTGIPDEILNAHGIKPLELASNKILDLTIAMQHDSAFMLDGVSGFERMKVLNGVTGNDTFDGALSQINRDIQEFGKKENETKQREEEAQTRLSVISPEKDALDELLLDTEVLRRKANVHLERVDLLEPLWKSWEMTCVDLGTKEGELSRLPDIELVEEILCRVESSWQRLQEIQQLYTNLLNNIQEKERTLNNLGALFVPDDFVMEDVDRRNARLVFMKQLADNFLTVDTELAELNFRLAKNVVVDDLVIDRLEESNTRISFIKSLYEQGRRWKEEYISTATQQELVDSSLEELLGEFSKLYGDFCMECGKPLSGEEKKRIALGVNYG